MHNQNVAPEQAVEVEATSTAVQELLMPEIEAAEAVPGAGHEEQQRTLNSTPKRNSSFEDLSPIPSTSQSGIKKRKTGESHILTSQEFLDNLKVKKGSIASRNKERKTNNQNPES